MPWGSTMRTVEEYRAYAEYCRLLAMQTGKTEYKKVLEEMAQMWERLAKEHERDLEPEPDLP
jgi:hypothetical protein